MSSISQFFHLRMVRTTGIFLPLFIAEATKESEREMRFKC